MKGGLFMDLTSENYANDYFIVKAEGNRVQVIGMTRGNETRPHHTENLDQGEVLIMQFTDKTSMIKIKGSAEIYTKYGTIKCEK